MAVGNKQSFASFHSRELPDYPSDQQGKHKEYEDARRWSKNGKKEPRLKY